MISIAKRFMLIAVLAIVGTVVIHSAASAQRYTCIFVNGCKVLIILDPCGNIIGTQTDCGSSGSGTFNGPVFPTQGPVPPSTLVAEQINATVQDPVYGAINTTLDPTRTATSIIASNNPTERYPLSVTISFYANATISAKPGVTYTSRQPLNFSSSNVNSLDPFNSETFTLQSDVEFYDPHGGALGGEEPTAFRLAAGSSVTLGGSAGGPGDINNPNGIR